MSPIPQSPNPQSLSPISPQSPPEYPPSPPSPPPPLPPPPFPSPLPGIRPDRGPCVSSCPARPGTCIAPATPLGPSLVYGTRHSASAPPTPSPGTTTNGTSQAAQPKNRQLPYVPFLRFMYARAWSAPPSPAPVARPGWCHASSSADWAPA